MKVKGKASAYVTHDMEYFLNHYKTMEPDQLVQMLVYYKDKCSVPDWVKVGTATITLELPPEGDMKGDAVIGLKAEQERIREEADRKIEQLQNRINSMLCLEYIPANE